MKITNSNTTKPKFGDVVVGKSGTMYMIIKDENDNARLLHLGTFNMFSAIYTNPESALRSYFTNGYTCFSHENNELVLGGFK